jgi:hypothetical protein
MGTMKFLPGTEYRVGSSPGRSLNMRGMFNPMLGTMRSMVEGALHAVQRLRMPPSVSAARCHLPVPGRI